MAHRDLLLGSLSEYYPEDTNERDALARIVAFIRAEPQCFERTNIAGHVTGSAMLISRDGNRVLLNHHKSLNLWIVFGGHADGDGDIFKVASRELAEESGISTFEPVRVGIFDLDVHDIPANPARNEAAHQHYDVCYLFQTTQSDDFLISNESHGIEWCSYEEAGRRCADDPRMLRMLKKWKNQF